jgi:hypothetical protein
MTRTKRIYNRRLKKAQRYDRDNPILDESGYIRLDSCIGVPFTWRSYICMGMCKMCRDPNREPRLIRKRRKEQFRFESKRELKKQICHGMCLYCGKSIYRFCNGC